MFKSFKLWCHSDSKLSIEFWKRGSSCCSRQQNTKHWVARTHGPWPRCLNEFSGRICFPKRIVFRVPCDALCVLVNHLNKYGFFPTRDEFLQRILSNDIIAFIQFSRHSVQVLFCFFISVPFCASVLQPSVDVISLRPSSSVFVCFSISLLFCCFAPLVAQAKTSPVRRDDTVG